jgi:membrane protease YdiL (CAAX protease family)
MSTDVETRRAGWIRRLLGIAPIRLLGLLTIFSLIYFGMASGAFALFKRVPDAMRVGYGALVTFVMVGVLLWLYPRLTRWIERRPAAELALAPGMRLLAVGTLVGMLCIHAIFVIYALRGMIASVHFTPSVAVMGALIVCILSALAEELIMRGIVLRVMEQWMGSGVAIGFSSLLFGLVHLNNPHATWIGALAIAVETGGMLGGAYLLYRNLWLPIGIHFGWNLTESVVYGAHNSGLDLKGLLTTAINGSDLMTGGEFGPEASLPAVGVGTFMAIVLITLAVRRGQWQPLRWQWRLPLAG